MLDVVFNKSFEMINVFNRNLWVHSFSGNFKPLLVNKCFEFVCSLLNFRFFSQFAFDLLSSLVNLFQYFKEFKLLVLQRYDDLLRDGISGHFMNGVIQTDA